MPLMMLGQETDLADTAKQSIKLLLLLLLCLSLESWDKVHKCPRLFPVCSILYLNNFFSVSRYPNVYFRPQSENDSYGQKSVKLNISQMSDFPAWL